MDSIAQNEPKFNSERAEWIGDDWKDLQPVDYLEPIIFPELYEAEKYAKSHCCGECRQQLIVVAADGAHAWQVVCPEGHESTRRTAITKQQAEQAEMAEHLGRIEIEAISKPRRTEAEIMAELGY